jgi:hypothetical protein
MLTLLLFACPPSTPESGTPKDDSSKESNSADNEAPSTPVIEISPDPAGEEDDLSVSILTESLDPEGSTVSYRYAWMVDGAASTETGATITADKTTTGQIWSVQVYPSDGELEGLPATDSILVGNPAPVAATIHLEPASPDPGDDLTLVIDSPASDPTGESLTETIRWWEDGEERVDLEGQVVINGTEVDGGESWMVVLSSSDGVNSPVEASDSVTASNQAPVIERVSISPGNPKDADDLTCSARVSDPDRDVTNTVYHWFRDGSEVLDVLDEVVVDNSYTTPEEEWYCSVTVSDGHAEATMDSDTVVISGPTKVFYNHDLTMTITPDGSGGWSAMTGDYELYVYTTGGYGYVDCNVLWELVGTPKAQPCRNCEYDFSFDATVDLASSTLLSKCSDLALDTTGEVYYESRGQSGELYMDNVFFAVTNPYYSYGYYYVTPYMSFGGNYSYSDPYYSRSYYFNTSYDGYGNLLVSTYVHLYVYMP